MQKTNIKRALISDMVLAVIILMVYFAAFMGVSLLGKPALKGSTAEDKVGLQIAIIEGSDIDSYIAVLEEHGFSATFFFDNSFTVKEQLSDRGYSTGFLHEREAIPVMSYGSGSRMISTSIDLDKLIQTSGWEELFEAKLAAGMLLFITADSNFDDFEKIVQIVLDKGYTIVKMEEMFTKER